MLAIECAFQMSSPAQAQEFNHFRIPSPAQKNMRIIIIINYMISGFPNSNSVISELCCVSFACETAI